MRAHAASLRTVPVPAFRWTAVICALAVWMMGLLAVSPQLHTALHSEASHLDHTCAVTLFSHGVENAVGSACVAGAPVLFSVGQCLVQPALPVAEAHHRLPPGCGPPLC
jgi:hypothetical protein